MTQETTDGPEALPGYQKVSEALSRAVERIGILQEANAILSEENESLATALSQALARIDSLENPEQQP